MCLDILAIREAITRLSRSPHGVWGALDPVTKLLLTIDVGDRTLAMAQRVVHQVVQVLAPALAAIEQVLAAYGWHINTAFIERVNLTIRQHVAAVGRRVMTLCKGEEGLYQQLALYHVYY
jgi:IS1 family transposase